MTWWLYIIIAALLVACELIYFKIADKCNIIDKPNDRSSHSTIVLRGGGIIFLLGVWVWACFNLVGEPVEPAYPWFLAAVTLAAGISFVDDIHSLPDPVSLCVQFLAMVMTIFQIIGLDGFAEYGWLLSIVIVAFALVVFVGATNIYNFMDVINGITAGYSSAVLIPLLLVNSGAGASLIFRL